MAERARSWRWDGFANELSGIGTGEDRHTSTQITPGQRLDREDIDELYETGRFGRKIVEKPAKDAMRPAIKLTDGKRRPFQGVLDEHDIESTIRQGLINARLTGGGALVFVVQDGRDLDEPIDWSNLQKVHAVHAFDRWDLSADEYHVDLRHKEYRKPRLYDFHPGGHGAASRIKGPKGEDVDTNAKIHSDRIIQFTGERVRDFRRSAYDGWAQPVLEAVFETMKDLGLCSDAIASAVHQFQYAVLKIAGLHELLVEHDNGRELFRDRLEAMEESKSIVNAVALDADRGEEIDQKSVDFGQAKEAYRILQENFSYDASIPVSVLFGQMPKGLSTKDETGRQNYFDSVEDIREDEVSPALMRIAKVFGAAADGPTNGQGVPDGIQVEYGPLDELTAPQESEIFKQRAGAHAELVKAKVETPKDAKARLFDDEEATTDNREAQGARLDALGASIGGLDAGPNRPVWRVPAEVRESARKGLRLRRSWGRGGNGPSKEIARSLISGVVNAEAARKIYGFLKSHRSNFDPESEHDDGGPTTGTITYLLWGGTEALESLEDEIGDTDLSEDVAPAAE